MNSVAGQQNLITLLPRLLYVVGKLRFFPAVLSGRQERGKTELK